MTTRTKQDVWIVIGLLLVSVWSLTQVYTESTHQHPTWYAKADRLDCPNCGE